jgi:dihydrofolate reductase
MGRKTYASIGRPLPGRDIVVVSRDPAFAAAGVLVARGIDEGLRLAAERAAASGAHSIAVAGGGEIYAATLPLADRLAITEVDLAPEADTFFPSIDPSVWRQVRRECGVRAAEDKVDFGFVDYVRR